MLYIASLAKNCRLSVLRIGNKIVAGRLSPAPIYVPSLLTEAVHLLDLAPVSRKMHNKSCEVMKITSHALKVRQFITNE